MGRHGAGKGCSGMDTVLLEVHEHPRTVTEHRSVQGTVWARQLGMAPHILLLPGSLSPLPPIYRAKAKSIRLVHPMCSPLLCVLC